MEERISVPTIAFGFDIQNYGNESQLIYSIDVEKLDPSNKIDEALITKKLSGVNCKISQIIDHKFEKTVVIIGDAKEPETILWPCPNCNQDTSAKEWIICCSQDCLKQWLTKTNQANK